MKIRSPSIIEVEGNVSDGDFSSSMCCKLLIWCLMNNRFEDGDKITFLSLLPGNEDSRPLFEPLPFFLLLHRSTWGTTKDTSPTPLHTGGKKDTDQVEPCIHPFINKIRVLEVTPIFDESRSFASLIRS